MPSLSNSQRRLYKATYAPTRPEDGKPITSGRAVAKSAFVAGLAMRPAEVDRVRRRLKDTGADPNLAAALTVISDIAASESPAAVHAQREALSSVPAQTLISIGHALAQERSAQAATAEHTISSLRDAYHAWLQTPAASPAPSAPTDTPATPDFPTVTTTGVDALGRAVRRSRQQQKTASGGKLILSVEPVREAPSTTPVAPAIGRTPVGTIDDAIAWAETQHPQQHAVLKKLATEHSRVSFGYTNAEPALAIAYLVPKLTEAAAFALAGVKAFEEQMKVEPVGRLHLERLEMTPVGVERGELVSSIPLTPKETVNISHREWSTVSQEFQSIVQDSFEGYSEEGVAEKTDVSQSTDNQSKHSRALTFGAAASASYLGVTISSTFGYNASSSDDQAQKDSRNHSVATTRQASARSKQDHKTSFRVASAAGTEDRAIRTITNPSETESMRVDYYQLMRKWRVDLYRYGLRMTYDIVIPSPGADLMSKIRNLADLDGELNKPFAFNLSVHNITRDNWQKLATTYQVAVDAPPPATLKLMSNVSIQQTDKDKDRSFVGAIDLDVDTNYTISGGKVIVGYYYFDVGSDKYDLVFDVYFDGTPGVIETAHDKYPSSSLQGSIIGRNGHVSIPYFHKGVESASITVVYNLALLDEVFQAWQSKAWAAMRSGAEAIYQERWQQLRDRRAALIADLTPFDALTLRRMEMEEIMKGTMRWLFGPAFNVSPKDIQNILDKMAANDPYGNDVMDTSVLSNQQWQRMMEFGEFIKFVQEAIEWENVLYFTYPYFWDTPKNWPLKQFLEHPDPDHRAFLRAGSARVVLTIRPGFEDSFAALVESGGFGKLPGDHPYVTIAQEIQDYAKTNYPGIPPANPANPPTEDEVNEGERGKLMATWWEYTPTSALDVALNTAFPEMA